MSTDPTTEPPIIPSSDEWFNPSYWTSVKAAINQSLSQSLRDGSVSQFSRSVWNFHKKSVLSRKPKPGDEAIYDEAKTVIEQLEQLMLGNFPPAIKVNPTPSSPAHEVAGIALEDQQGGPPPFQGNSSSDPRPAPPSAISITQPQLPFAAHASTNHIGIEVNLREISELVEDYLNRHSNLIPFALALSRDAHLASYQEGLELYRNWFARRTVG